MNGISRNRHVGRLLPTLSLRDRKPLLEAVNPTRSEEIQLLTRYFCALRPRQ